MKFWRRVLGIVVLLLFLALVLGPFLVPVPPLAGLVAAASLAEPDSRFAELPLGSSTLSVHYKMAGNGTPNLVLLHGFGASLFTWREVMQPLAANATVAALDRPAFGLTERPLRDSWGSGADWERTNPYSPAAQVALTVGLMDELEMQQAVLVGNSAGGTIAMLTALAHPDRVQALILLDPAVYTGGGGNGLTRLLFATPQMQHLGPLVARQIRSWGTDFARSAWHDPSRISDAVWKGYTRPLQIENWDRALWELTRASQPSELAARLAEFTLPVLVITGDDDRIVPTADSVRLAEELPNAQLVVIPNCGHVPHEECPQAVLEAVQSFLAELK